MVAAHRQDRPWSGAIHDSSSETVPEYDPGCHFCPGNQRVSGMKNPDYESIFVFDNDHPCVGEAAPRDLQSPAAPYANRPADGIARVVCYHPRHDLSLSRMGAASVEELLRCWQDQYRDLGGRSGVKHVLIFENRGRAVGVSNPHPHCQIYATNFVFKTIENEAAFTREHWQDSGRSILAEMIDAERADGRRVVRENGRAISFVPYCARWAYEVFVAPKRVCSSITDLDSDELRDFAEVLSDVTIRYDNLWEREFPYILVLHNAPTDGSQHPGFHFHIELHPPLRKPHLRKYLAGPETGGGSFLSDTWPEDKAAELRALSNIHYAER